MLLSTRSLLLAIGMVSVGTVILAACGSTPSSQFGDGKEKEEGTSSGSFGNPFGSNDAATAPDVDLYANDPPPKWCGPTNGPAAPPPPGGTEDCPDDKNKPGCGCGTPGEQAPCWTGLRANRNLGICKDGVTTCLAVNETRNAWGECVGQVLPVVGGKGKDACRCFSQGEWKLANLTTCFIHTGDPATPQNVYALAAPLDQNNQPLCSAQGNPPFKPPSDTWTADSLNVDCAGHFKLCFELKAGNFDDPKPTDCSLAKVCVEADYEKENVEQAFPPLPSWYSTDTACGYKWEEEGGYGEMTVIGKSVRCDEIDDGSGNSFVFNRVRYCPKKCRSGQNPDDPECKACQAAGSGKF